ncbi:unnamed protein product, partial [Sphacelaria rigidula]
RWKSLDESERERYNGASRAAMQSWMAEKDAILAKNDAHSPRSPEWPGRGGGKKKSGTDDVPSLKRPKNAYILFQEARRPILRERKKLTPREMLSALGREWRDLEQADKAQYEKRAAELKEEYVSQKAA